LNKSIEKREVSAMSSHNFGICRTLYRNARTKGSPVVYVTELSPGFMIGETQDGDVKIEDVRACCKWAAKYECAARWLEKNVKI
jgi:hypothetical protein